MAPINAPPQGVNIMAFCKEYNAATAKMAGDVIPVEITVYEVSRPAAAGTAATGHTSCGRCGQAAWAARAMVTLQLLAAARFCCCCHITHSSTNIA